VAIGRDVLEVVVVQVSIFDVVSRRVTLIRVVEPAVVNRNLGSDIVRPAYMGEGVSPEMSMDKGSWGLKLTDTKCLVMVAEYGPRNSQICRI
jgi:hypothetical protein